MTSSEKQGIFARQKPTEDEIAAIQQLTTVCNAFESIHIHLYGRDMFKQRSGNETLDFLYYEQGQLVGYLGLDNYGTQQKECTGMVHPEHRRKGIARQLLQAAKEVGRHSGIEQLVLDCERSSTSGTAFVQAMHTRLDFSEHEMVLGTLRESNTFDDRLLFQQANNDDLEIVASIRAADMDGDKERALRRVKEIAQQRGQRFYFATFGDEQLGCHEPVGTLRLDERDDEVGIYGFVVLPEYRGRGYGRQMLEEAIHLISDEGSKKVMLDVDVNNTNALGLYLSCGFEIVTTYDYYIVEVV
ncbi:MAG: GNAT family N-acetyltransferase [Ktedonobacteraceae bacterium]